MVTSLTLKHLTLTRTITVTKHSYVPSCNPQNLVTSYFTFTKLTPDSCGFGVKFFMPCNKDEDESYGYV